MARPPAADDSQKGLVEFDPEEEAPEEIYEVDVGVNPAIAATPTPGAGPDRAESPLPAARPAVPAPGDLRASLAGRHREIGSDDEPRRGRGRTALLAIALMTVGCTGVLGLTGLGIVLTTTAPSAPRAEPDVPEAPPEFGGVPVERGFRRGGAPAPGPAPRPEEPTP